MARTWSVTGPTKTMLSGATGEAAFTITNLVAQPMRGLVRVLPEGNAKPEMFTVVGETTLDWAPNETKQVTIQINAAGAQAGTYLYDFAIVSELSPDELSDRISSSFDVVAAPVRKFPVGLLAAILAAVIVIGAAVWFFWPNDDGDDNKTQPVLAAEITSDCLAGDVFTVAAGGTCDAQISMSAFIFREVRLEQTAGSSIITLFSPVGGPDQRVLSSGDDGSFSVHQDGGTLRLECTGTDACSVRLQV